LAGYSPGKRQGSLFQRKEKKMAKADLHVHSLYSENPSEWFLQRIGARESYTDPEFIYRAAKDKGMTLVTVTDHNRIEGSLRLQEKHPQDVFTGLEATAYFPEDKCKIHVLVYGLTSSQFEEIQKLRTDIYQLREYLYREGLAHAVAHATFSINGRLKLAHLERLLLLFEVFETVNGGRSEANNRVWRDAISRLTPDRIEDLYRKHRILPMSTDPWRKGMIGGSDDHAGLFLGRSHTLAPEEEPDGFLRMIREKRTQVTGSSNDYKSLAFTIYKVAFDFSKSRNVNMPDSLLNRISEFMFEKPKIGWRERIGWRWKTRSRPGNEDRVSRLLLDLVESAKSNGDLPWEEKSDLIFNQISDLSDEFIRNLARSLEEDFAAGRFAGVVKNMLAAVPGVLLAAPFFSTLRLMHNNRPLLTEVAAQFGGESEKRQKRILWFSDTLMDLNGVSVSLMEMGLQASARGLDLRLVSSFLPGEQPQHPPDNLINLEQVYAFRLPGYDRYVLKIPAFLKAMERLARLDPDEIYLSTPGPIGLLGLLLARALRVKCVGVYHTDFPAQAFQIFRDEQLAALLESAQKWFYGSMDEIRVPTCEYIDILEKRGLDRNRMRIFPRGIDTDLFSPRREARAHLRQTHHIPPGHNLLFAGRISPDKGVDFLAEVFSRLQADRSDLNLLLAGDGPYLAALREKLRKSPRVFFLGRLDYRFLPEVYSGSDLLLFPSTTDTFGMVVLEAQACGLPAVVSDIGGPKEIVRDGQTGLIARAGDLDDWAKKILGLLSLLQDSPSHFEKMRNECRLRVLERHDWEMVLADIFRPEGKETFRARERGEEMKEKWLWPGSPEEIPAKQSKDIQREKQFCPGPPEEIPGETVAC
jgi:glycosyltransferase involved in cell wall biosynthesis/predicted metal-dependent phosphoesterase TrpH